MTRLHVLQSDPQSLPTDFWTSSSCELMIIARWAQDRSSEVAWLHKHLPDLPKHVWLSTSGTLAAPGASQWIAISKDALLVNAESVNQHLNAQKNEAWGLALPLAHVGGLGILARAYLLGQQVVGLTLTSWDPHRVATGAWQGQLLSLVPTQVHDLVKNRLQPPAGLRAVVVGGDRLSPELYLQGRELGWPLLPSYGLTECGSQIATATEGQTTLKLLSHVKATTDEEDRLWLESAALFTGKADVLLDKLTWHPRQNGAWATQDRAEIQNEQLTLLGRMDHVVKVRGEKVDLSALEAELQTKFKTTLIIIPLTDERDGVALWVVSEEDIALETLNEGLLPHQRIRGVRRLASIPRTALGKIRRGEIKAMLQG